MDVVHHTHPFHLAIHFKLFRDTLSFRHLIHKLRNHSLGLLINFEKIAVQLARQ